MDAVAQIEDLIVSGAEGFFDDADDRVNLHVTLRIAFDFYNFLLGAGEQARSARIDYVLGTIRSGIDHFFALAHACAIINTPRDSWEVHSRGPSDLAVLREDFMAGFERLQGSADATTIERLAWLLALTHLELVFLGQHFPSAILHLDVERHSERRLP